MSRLYAMIADACLGPDRSFEHDLRAFLESRDVDRADVDALLAAPNRLGVYRRLVRHNLVEVVALMLPRTRARLERAALGEFDRTFDRFLSERSARTHYLRDVPAEFLAWVVPQWRDDSRAPPYLADLAAHEIAHFAVAAAPHAREAPTLDEVALDRPLVFSDALRLASYGYAVHELPGETDDATEPPKREVTLLAYRDEEHAVRFLELTPLAAAIVARLVAGDVLGDAIARACDDQGVARTGDVLGETARLLADLGERGVVLGAASTQSKR